MTYILKSLKNIEKITRAYKSIYRIKKLLTAFLVIYSGFLIFMYFGKK